MIYNRGTNQQSFLIAVSLQGILYGLLNQADVVLA